MNRRRKDGKPYANAGDVLPAAMVRSIQRHFAGGFLWIPVLKRRRRKTAGQDRRNRSMIRERRNGASLRDLAAKHGLCEERVRQIVAGRRTDR